MTIDELLCKFQGLHWHEGVTYPDGTQSRYKCSCMEHQSIYPLSSLNPDFSDDRVAMELLRWFQEEKVEMYGAFESWVWKGCRISYRDKYFKWLHQMIGWEGKSYMRWVVLLAEWLRLEENEEGGKS